MGIQTSLWMGCPIRIREVLRLCAAPLTRFAGLRVLLRPSAPGHPPRTLHCLFAFILPACYQAVLCSLCSSRLFSALGKIEVIILYHISAMQL